MKRTLLLIAGLFIAVGAGKAIADNLTFYGILPPTAGGTGAANATTSTLTLGGALTTTGAGSQTFAMPASPFTYTFQGSSDTVVGRATTDTLTNKTITAPVLSGTATGTYTLGGTPTLVAHTVSSNATALTPPAGTMIEIGSADASNTVVNVDAFGALPDLLFRRADGTNASKSAVQLNETFGAIQGSGFGASAYGAARSSLLMVATENWTNTAQGSAVQLLTTKTGSLTSIISQIWDGVGHWVTGGSGPTCGAGCSSVAGNDNAFVVTTGAAQTSIAVTFGAAWGANPVCNVSSNSTASVTDIASVSTTAITFGASVALSGALLYVNCRQ